MSRARKAYKHVSLCQSESSYSSCKDNSSGGDELSESDPEMIAEVEYAREHGTELPETVSKLLKPENKSQPLEFKPRQPNTLKANQAKAARKARGRGVSGSMSKKDAGYDMDLDEYYDDFDYDEEDDDVYDGADTSEVHNLHNNCVYITNQPSKVKKDRSRSISKSVSIESEDLRINEGEFKGEASGDGKGK